MKKITYLLIAFALVLSVVSCGNKDDKNDDKDKTEEVAKAKDLDGLIKKYDGVEFKDCDEFLAAANEMLDVFVLTIDKAYEGDEKAEEDFMKLTEFMEQFDEQAQKFEEECPEKMAEFDKKSEEKFEPIMDKLMEISFRQMASEMDETGEEFAEDMDNAVEELESEIDETIEQIDDNVENAIDNL
ncbi:MAG TPA: hypothetical protein PLO05_02170 [Bacteroidales bacterium]|nr:hypothetical protein [Bacteroidales bacterium]